MSKYIVGDRIQYGLVNPRTPNQSKMMNVVIEIVRVRPNISRSEITPRIYHTYDVILVSATEDTKTATLGLIGGTIPGLQESSLDVGVLINANRN